MLRCLVFPLSLSLSRSLFLSLLRGTDLPTQLSSATEGEDHQNAERLCSASAIFLALYDEPAAATAAPEAKGSPSGAAGSATCRLGDLLRQVRVVVVWYPFDKIQHLHHVICE